MGCRSRDKQPGCELQIHSKRVLLSDQNPRATLPGGILKVLLFGGNGQVGTELRRAFEGSQMVVLPRAECDLTEPTAIENAIRSTAPDVILNAAAYTAVDAAESERDSCFAINARAPEVMAKAAAARGATLVHYSTDYVFDGNKRTPYVETDPTNPLNQYGRSKAEGEAAIQRTGARAFILRTSWVFSPYGKNFVKTMLRLASERRPMRIVNDQIGAPTSARALADATHRMLERGALDANVPGGVYHLAAEGHASWAQFAREIFRVARPDDPPTIEEVSSEEFPTPARRPKNSRLASDKFASQFGFRLSSWQVQLKEALVSLDSGGSPSKEQSHQD